MPFSLRYFIISLFHYCFFTLIIIAAIFDVDAISYARASSVITRCAGAARRRAMCSGASRARCLRRYGTPMSRAFMLRGAARSARRALWRTPPIFILVSRPPLLIFATPPLFMLIISADYFHFRQRRRCRHFASRRHADITPLTPLIFRVFAAQPLRCHYFRHAIAIRRHFGDDTPAFAASRLPPISRRCRH